MTVKDCIEQTRCWVQNIVIDLNFCPFAKREFVQNRIRYEVCQDITNEAALHKLADELHYLQQHTEIETTLLIFSQGYADFQHFLELIEFSDILIDELGFRSEFQLAHFHPDYQFHETETDDPANFTNRAPWPTLHILRESTLRLAIDQHRDTALIPENNIRLARSLGFDKMQTLLNHCKNKTC